MKKTIKIFAILIIILFSFPLIKKGFESKEYKIKMHVYKHEDYSNIISRYLRLIPLRYCNKYELTLISDSAAYQTFRIDDLIYGVPSHSYIIYHKNKKRIVDLMSHRLIIAAVEKGIVNERNLDLDKYYDLLINKTELNRVCNLQTLQEKMIFYCDLLRTGIDSSTFSIVKTKKDIDRILKERPQSEGSIIDFSLIIISGDPLPILDDFAFLQEITRYNEICYWYFDQGIIHYIFEFDSNNEIISVKHNFIGYLGNEVKHL